MNTKPYTKTRKRLLVGILPAFLLLLTGCVRLEMDVELYENDTADVSMTIIDQTGGMLFDSEMGFGSCDELYDELDEDSPQGESVETTVEEFTGDDGNKGCIISATGVDLEDAFSQAAGAEDGGIQREGDDFIVSIPADGTMNNEIGEVAFSFTFPGEVTNDGGGTVSNNGRTVTFEDNQIYEGIDISGKATDEASIMTILYIAIGILILLAVIGGGLFFWNKNKGKNSTVKDDNVNDNHPQSGTPPPNVNTGRQEDGTGYYNSPPHPAQEGGVPGAQQSPGETPPPPAADTRFAPPHGGNYDQGGSGPLPPPAPDTRQ